MGLGKRLWVEGEEGNEDAFVRNRIRRSRLLLGEQSSEFGESRRGGASCRKGKKEGGKT